MLRRFFYRCTGGRPMHRIGFAFTDKVTGEPVFRYVDAFGRFWLANKGFTLFRVEA